MTDFISVTLLSYTFVDQSHEEHLSKGTAIIIQPVKLDPTGLGSWPYMLHVESILFEKTKETKLPTTLL